MSCSTTKKIVKSTTISESVEIIQEGVINCFNNEIYDKKNNPINCEASAIFLSNSGLVIAEDKEINKEGLSQVFTIPLSENFPNLIPSTSVSFLTASAFNDVRKIEDMTKESTGKLCFATTDFEWITKTPQEADAYNSILYWTDGDYGSIKYIAETVDKGIKSSKPLRERFLNALRSQEYPQGPPYYKIEGICAIPDSILLFGVREIGNSYEHPTYTFIILSTNYHSVNEEIVLDNSFNKIYEINPQIQTGYKMGLSSITYNKFKNELFFSTSFENLDSLESNKYFSFLWNISMADFTSKKPAQILKDKNGNMFRFNHKIEGITVLTNDKIFTVSDQDRYIGPVNLSSSVLNRKTYQAIYTVIKLDY